MSSSLNTPSASKAPPPLTRQLTSHLDQFAQDFDLADEDRETTKGKEFQGETADVNFRFLVGEATDIGGGNVNQDTYTVFRTHGNLIMAVFDGHGRELGELAAQVARDSVKEQLEDISVLERVSQNAESTLSEVFRNAHQAIKDSFRERYLSAKWEVEETPEGYLIKRKNSSSSWTCTHGGTTGTVVIIFGGSDRMIVANVGDSTALWGGCASDGSLLETELSAEHSPESAAEFKRIREFRSEPDGRMPDLRFVYDSPSFSKNQCPRIFNVDAEKHDKITITGNGNYYKNVRSEWATLVTTPPHARFQDALAFTRSLGDLHLHVYGVSSEPEVVEYDLKEVHEKGCHNKFGVSALLVCTDGVWDNWKYPDIIKMALQDDLVQTAVDTDSGAASCAALMDENIRLAKNHFGPQADNMTAILCYVIKV